jgi:HEAT repeat protein
MEVKRETSAILKKLFEKEVSNRYQDAEKVLQDLREIKDIQRSKKIEFLLYLLNTTDDRYRRQAINDLAEFGYYAGVAVPQLISLLQEDDFQLYIPASYTLVKIGENSVPSLAELLKHEKLKIRRRAATTLEQIGVQAKAAIPQLIQALEDSDPDGNVPWYAVITIGKIGVPAQKAIPVLIEKLNDPQPGIRAWTLYALGKMGNLAREAESIIWEILSQENQNVFMVGIEALDSIGANIDQIQFNHIENNITITLREWVLLRREELKPQEAPTKAFMLEFEPKLNPWPPPLKDPHNFRNP